MDHKLLEFADATPQGRGQYSQREKVQAVIDHGSMRAAARALGIHHKSVQRTIQSVRKAAARRGFSPEHHMTRPVPDGYRAETTTLFDSDGDVKLQWVKSKEDKEKQERAVEAMARAFSEELPKRKVIPAPKVSNNDFLALYPVGDHHMGSLIKADDHSYDILSAVLILEHAVDYLVSASPAASRAAVVFMGDYLDWDGMVNKTPAGGFHRDAAGMPEDMVAAGYRSMIYTIEAAAKKHKRVDVFVLSGNHDPYGSIHLVTALSHIYLNNPRVHIDISRNRHKYLRFEKCLVGMHHGDKGARLADLPLIMATDRQKDWGETSMRIFLTGHKHHREEKELPGCLVIQLPVLTPNDRHSQSSGYRSRRAMDCFILHKDGGIPSRHTFDPQMFE